MEKTQINVRVDESLKFKVEEACDYLGVSITEIVNRQFRSTIDEYYKKRAEDTRIAREILEGDQADLLLQSAKREVYALKELGFDSILELNKTPDITRFHMFYGFVYSLVCRDLGIKNHGQNTINQDS